MPRDDWAKKKSRDIAARALQNERVPDHPVKFHVRTGSDPLNREQDMVARFKGKGAGHAPTVPEEMVAEFHFSGKPENIVNLLKPVLPELAKILENGTKSEHFQVSGGRKNKELKVTISVEDFLKLAAHYNVEPKRGGLVMGDPALKAMWEAITEGRGNPPQRG